MYIKYSSSVNLTNSLIIHETDDTEGIINCLIIGSLITYPSEGKETSITIYKFKNFEKVRIKSLTCFSNQFNIMVVILSHGSFVH